MKKALVGLLCLAALLAAIVVVVPRFVPVDVFRGRIVALVKQSTGRDLKIAGPVTLSLVPTLALQADDVTLSNAPGGMAVDMARLKSLQIDLKLFPLLRGMVVVDRLVLVAPAIALEVDTDGRPNWVFARPPAAASPAAPAAGANQGERGASLSELRLDDVELTNGTISYANRRTGKQVSITGIAMKVSLPSLDAPCTFDGSAVWNNEPVALAATIAKPGLLERGGPSPLWIKLRSKPVTFSFDGNASGATIDGMDGAVDLSMPSLRDFATWTGYPLTLGGNGFGPLAVKGKIAAAGSVYTFSNAALSLDAVKSQGELTLDTGGARLYAKARLSIDQLDLNPYLAANSAGPAKPSSGSAAPDHGSAPGWNDEPIDVAGLKAIDADLDLSAGGIQYRKITLGKSALTVHLKDGRLGADLGQIALYDGSGQGKLAIDGSGALPAVQASFSLVRVQIGPLLTDTIGMDRLSGTGSVEIAVSGHGRSEQDLIATLEGRGAINLAKGTYKGANLPGLVKNAAASLNGGGQQTDFSSLSATYVIAAGIVRNNDLKLVSAELPMEGSGTVDLPRRRVDYKVTPRLAGIVAVPVLISGPWEQLTYRPDLVGIVADPAKIVGGVMTQGAKGIGGTARDLGNPLGGALKGLLGK